MTALVIDLRTRRPLVHQLSGDPDDRTTFTLRRVAVIGRDRGMAEPDARLLAAWALRRLRSGQSHDSVIAWARAFADDFRRHANAN